MDNFKKQFWGPKIIFAILSLIILVELIYAVVALTSPVPSPSPAPKVSIKKSGGKISLNVSKPNFSVNETISVTVLVDTGSYSVSGIDLIVHFDPKVLEATNASLTKGKILDEYPYLAVDSKKGLVSISGVSAVNKSFKGRGQFALINFKSKLPGKTSLSIDFKIGSTTASNLVDTATSKNILEQVNNLELNIQ